MVRTPAESRILVACGVISLWHRPRAECRDEAHAIAQRQMQMMNENRAFCGGGRGSCISGCEYGCGCNKGAQSGKIRGWNVANQRRSVTRPMSDPTSVLDKKVGLSISVPLSPFPDVVVINNIMRLLGLIEPRRIQP